MSQRPFLRSIHLKADLAAPGRVAHYRATSKSLAVVDAVLGRRGDSATMVIAAYGSGKSLAAAVAGLTIANTPEANAVVAGFNADITSIDPELGAAIAARRDAGARGLVLALHGHVADLAAALADAAGIAAGADLAATLDLLEQHVRERGFDHAAVIWDEFGRHLEALAASGHAGDLIAVQELAEWCARRNGPTVTLTTLLHQSLLAYSGQLSHTARQAWRKIEGRFAQLRFLEDSSELYELLAALIHEATGERRRLRDARRLAATARERGFFAQFDEGERLATVLAQAAPFTPAALDLLPLLAARIAQNERTIFDFLANLTPTSRIGIEELYAFFAESMRADTGTGGTHRRWIETESARSRAQDDLEREVLAGACLLQLGSAGERRRVARDQLAFAVGAGGRHGVAPTGAAIDALIERKLLIHRYRNDDISVWHGADLDLRSLIDERKNSAAAEFTLVDALAADHPAPAVLPLRYNTQFGLTRFYRGVYIRASALIADGFGALAEPPKPDDADGRVVYVLAETPEQIAAVETLARRLPADRSDLVLVLPKRPLDIAETALELFVLRRLAREHELLEKDPLIEPELQELSTATREHLTRLLDDLTLPDRGRTRWFATGGDLAVDGGRPAGEALSRLVEQRFPRTPRIANDQIVRRRPSKPMINARKKCVRAILENTGAAEFEMVGWTTPDASIARTVFIHTGLYRDGGGWWRWARPEEVADPALAEIWRRIEIFFTEPRERDGRAVAKTVGELTQALVAPPYGLRAGLVPLLLAAGLRAFARCIAIREARGHAYVYVDDITPSVIEAIAAEPTRFEIEVHRLDADVAAYLAGIRDIFTDVPDAHEGDLVRACFDAMEGWRRQLPAAALTTKSLGRDVTPFQTALRQTSDPLDLIFRAFPQISGAGENWPRVIDYVATMRRRVESVIDGYIEQAITIAARRFAVVVNGDSDLITRASAWAQCFPPESLAIERLDGITKSILLRTRRLADGDDTTASFVRALSGIMLGRGFEQWNDGTGRDFERRLNAHLEAIERVALEAEHIDPAAVPLLQSRVADFVARLHQTVGEADTMSFLDSLRQRKDQP